MTIILAIAIIAVVSYLLGSLNFGTIVSKLLAKDDVRLHGSGGAGMTNVLRTYGKGPAALTAIGDFSKAVISIVFSRILFNRLGFTFLDAGYIAGLFVILGHVYPVFFGFRGGKGVMTTLGVMMLVNPIVFLIIIIIFVPVVFITKIVSLASVLGAIVYPIITFIVARVMNQPVFFSTLFAAVYMAIVLVMHRSNIKRLLNGTEYKFGQKKK